MKYADGTESGYVDETEQERSERAHRDAEQCSAIRRSLQRGGWLKAVDVNAIQNHRVMWRSV